jgi:hypothetical protein
MSEYQYYEFRAIDHPLTKKQMDEVREYSSRAEITKNHFINEYHYGDFKGDEVKFIERYFDAMVYFANWGTRRFMFRVPADLVDRKLIEPYCGVQSADLKVKSGHLILDLNTGCDDGGGYDDDDDESDDGWMSGLIGIRAEVIAGDLRPLYIAWLAGSYELEDDDSELEPPVPPGLKKLTASQKQLATFLLVDPNLIDVAAEVSADLEAKDFDADFNAWLTALPPDEKDKLLVSLAANADPFLPTRLRRQFQSQQSGSIAFAGHRRMVSDLIQRAAQLEAEREAAAAEAAAKKRAKQKAEAARERAAHLDRVAARGEAPWNEVENFVTSKNQISYDAAVKLLGDLRDIAARGGAVAQFSMRVRRLMERHSSKSSFKKRMIKANLMP